MTTPNPATTAPSYPPRIRFPYGTDGRGRTASCTEHQHVRELIEQLMLTSPGERVMRPTFGGALMQRIFEPGGPELLATTQYVVQASLSQYLRNRISVDALDVESRDNLLVVRVSWTLLSSGEQLVTDVAVPGSNA